MGIPGLHNEAMLWPAPYPRTIASGELGDADGLKLSVATVAATATYTGATLDGALANPGPGTLAEPVPFRVTVSAAASVGTYNIVDPITVVGTDYLGNAQTEELTLTEVNGNETVTSTLGFRSVVSVAFPAQNDANGFFTVGSGNALLTRFARLVRAGSIGNVVAILEDGTTATIPSQLAEKHDVMFGELSSTSTAWPITLYT